MPSIARSLTLYVRPSLVRHLAIATLLAGATFTAACSGSPTGPGAFSSERRVGTGGAGGTVSPGCLDGSGICDVQVTTASGTLSGLTDVAITSDTEFVFKSQLDPTKDGKFSGGGYIEVEVSGGTATIVEISFRRGDSRLGDGGVRVPASVTVTEGACRGGGDLVETTIVATLQNFGPTTITERHCNMLLSQ